MSPIQARGRFITFEGIDGAGKSSQIAAVVDLLRARGCDVDQTREPGGTALGERLRELLLHEPMDLETEAMLMFARTEMDTLVFDRYIVRKNYDETPLFGNAQEQQAAGVASAR